ncbi:MAG: MATE family efflux transporter [Lachnospiraceae bacterium]|nr:MATE family efflux transporter [Lachnospiraceae bacterium]
MKKNTVTTGMPDLKVFQKKLLTLVLPIAFQQFMLALVSASDALMLGALSQDALSAVSLASQITFVQNLFLAAMTIGLSALAAQFWGKGDTAAVERIFAYVLRITVMVSLLFSIATLCFPEYLMHIFTSDPYLVEQGAVYLRSVSLSYLLTGISQIYLCVLKNSEKAVMSSMISSVSVILNIVLNAILIFGLLGFPKLEIAGAAFATVTAKIVEVIWCFLETAKKDRIKLRWRALIKSDTVLRRDFWRYTAPILGNEIIWGIGFTMYSVIMGHLGSDAVAANSIANIVKNLVACFCLGLGNGGGIIVGNELGAGKLQTAKEYGRKLCRLSILCGAVSGAFLLIISPLILSVTNLSPQANTYLRWMLVMCSYYLIAKSVNSTTIAGIFCAGGDSKFGFFCDTVTMWCIVVPLGMIMAFVLKLPVLVIYFILNLDEIIKLPAVYQHYKKYKWVRDLTQKEEMK